MKIFPTSLLKDHSEPNFTTCGYLSNHMWRDCIKRYGNVETTIVENCDYVFLFISWLGDEFAFDHVAASKIAFLQKPIIVIDFTEYGSYMGEIHLPEYNIYGYKTEYDSLLYKEHRLIHEFLLANQSLIKCYFKRELGSTVDLSVIPFKVHPIDYIHESYIGTDKPQSFDDFLKRPIRINFTWGYSSMSRPKLYGGILKDIDRFKCLFATTFRQCDELLNTKEHFLLLNHLEYYERIDHSKLIDYQRKSRIVIDLFGCGMKCFRNVESTANALSAKQDPTKLVYTYPWKDGENCIVLPTLPGQSLIDVDKSIEILLKYQHAGQHLLHKMYLNSVETNKLYAPERYVSNHIMKKVLE